MAHASEDASGIAGDIAEVGERINRWRATRAKRAPMPEPLWDAAVRLAETHGIYLIARRLPVNYQSLKGRVVAATRVREPQGAKRAMASFVELRPTVPLPSALLLTGPSVELVDARGPTLTMRLGSGERLDVVGLARAFGLAGHDPDHAPDARVGRRGGRRCHGRWGRNRSGRWGK
jgi:hypothetical protein